MKIEAPAKPTKYSPETILGRERFEKFSAVEGIFLTLEDKLLFAEMDRKQLSYDERRAAILALYKTKK
jgi:hypothetical protein